MKTIQYLVSGLLLIYSLISDAAHYRDYVDYYVDWYGSIKASENTQVATAHQIFERLKKLANKNPKFLNPKLRVLKNKGRTPWARALRDGNIVLWKSAIEACYQGARSKEEIEARLAFVLGHELGHLAKDDYWHLDIACMFSTKKCKTSRFFTKERMIKELRADGEGYAYAALAGYRVDLLLGKKPFLSYWLKQIKPPKNSPYPPIKERVAVLQKYLQNIQKKLTFFDFGVRLSHFERCDDGEYFLREFQHIFPAREVLNNMGFCYLQRARQKMKSERAYFYWMPLVLDVETLAASLKTPSYFSISFKSLKQAAASGQGEGFLKEAMIYFKKAVEADQGYLPAQLNLAVTYLYLGKPHKARSVLEEAQHLAPDNLEIQALQALALYEQSEVDLDLWPRTVARLEKMAIKAQAPPALLYNLARLLEIRPRPGQARQYWNRLARMADSLPTPIRMHVCQQQSVVENCFFQNGQTSPKAAPWEWPIPFTWQALSTQVSVRIKLNQWKKTPFDWYREKLHGHIYQHPDGHVEVLELDDFMQMQVLKGGDLGTVKNLSEYCGQPLRQRQLARGVLWTCGEWAALVFEDKVQEVWRVLGR